jgi:alkanesulfonate monooxygenase SsuD/methylene tetrahydromethanopterin reductase-like flavin-dependent oxidoreductase (luciferase family)
VAGVVRFYARRVTTVDIQFSPARCEWGELRDACIAADEGDFGALWVYDHLAGSALGGTTMIECFTLLGALAELTTRIELGAMVVNVWNRQVGTLVSAAASVAIVSGRQFHIGIGAGTSPRSQWAGEQAAVGNYVADSLPERHARVEEVLDLMAAEWAPDRDPALATFPLPSPVPSCILGVGSEALARIAGRRAHGVNVPWHNPRRDVLLGAASDEAARHGRALLLTVWTHYDEALLDPEHPQRRAMRAAGIDRLVLAELGQPRRVSSAGPRRFL